MARSVVAHTRRICQARANSSNLGRIGHSRHHGDVDQVAQARQRPVRPGVRGKQQRVVGGRQHEQPVGPVAGRHGCLDQLGGARRLEAHDPFRRVVHLDQERQ